MGVEHGSQVRIVLYHHCTTKQSIRQNVYALSRLGFSYENMRHNQYSARKLIDMAVYLGIHYNARGTPMFTLSLVRLIMTLAHMKNGIKSSWVVPQGLPNMVPI